MFSLILFVLGITFVVSVTAISYKLGQTKTENAKLAGIIGFLLSFLPPLALIYLAILVFKEEVGTV